MSSIVVSELFMDIEKEFNVRIDNEDMLQLTSLAKVHIYLLDAVDMPKTSIPPKHYQDDIWQRLQQVVSKHNNMPIELITKEYELFVFD